MAPKEQHALRLARNGCEASKFVSDVAEHIFSSKDESSVLNAGDC
jgi:hypothetical protein